MASERKSQECPRSALRTGTRSYAGLDKLQQRIKDGVNDDEKEHDDMRELEACMQKLETFFEQRKQVGGKGVHCIAKKEADRAEEDKTSVVDAEKPEGENTDKYDAQLHCKSTINEDTKPEQYPHLQYEQEKQPPITPQRPPTVSHPRPKRWRLADDASISWNLAISSKPGTKSNQKANTFPTLPALHSTPSTPTNRLSRERLIFLSHKRYRQVRALFPLASEPDHAASLRWNDLCNLITAAPMHCLIIPGHGGAGFTVVRPARDGVLRRQVVIHKPHGRNPEVERHVLENMGSELVKHIGWRRSDFVFEG